MEDVCRAGFQKVTRAELRDEQFEGAQSGKGHSVSSTAQLDGEEWVSATGDLGEAWQRKGTGPHGRRPQQSGGLARLGME